MSDIMIHNETGFELAAWIIDSIKADSIEYFGESIASIRVQVGAYRHGFNVKTREVRYAFFPDEYDLQKSQRVADDSASIEMVTISSSGRSSWKLPDDYDSDDGEGVDLDTLSRDFDPLDMEDDGDFEGVDAEFDEMDDGDVVTLGGGENDFD